VSTEGTTERDHAALEAALKQTWSALGIDVGELERTETAIATNPAPAPIPLSPLLDPNEDGVAPILLGDLLGEGGMGVVHAATQTALQRTVAVKSLRTETPKAEQALQLLREGRVTGLLEHPNIVPVHTLGRDSAGQPMIVMKRIDGTPWDSMLADVPMAERMTPLFLREHLGHLRQVALALHFAHSQGILHRDLKPDNVMIGAFGEVYLVDWGVAVSTGEGGPAGVPFARDVKRIEGTPVYMAPEMALGNGEQLGVCSDVYLLGATLHHVITGAPPHNGPHIQAVLMQAFISLAPGYGPLVPPELAAIARRAMSRDPDARFESAAAFADALDEFLLHRGSLELCEEGERRAAEFERLAESHEYDNDAVESLFHEARFAFEQALRSWPENTRARDGRRTLVESMIAFELERGSPRVALALLRTHDDPTESLTDGVMLAVGRLDTVERDADLSLGVEQRVRRAIAAAVGWGAFCISCGALTRYDIFPIDHFRFAALGSAFFIGSLLSYVVWRRNATVVTASNRRIAFTSFLVFGGGLVLWPLLGFVGVSMPHATVLGAFFGANLWATVVFFAGRPWLPMPIGHLLVSVLAFAWPAYHFEVYGLLAVAIIMTAWLMRRAVVRSDEPTAVGG